MEQTNPIGEVKADSAVENYIAIVCAQWDETNPKRKWWQFWKRTSFVRVTNFLLKALDDLIAYVDEVIETSGADKKATVIWAVEKIYDYVVREAMPVWLKPFSPQIKDIIINGIVSPAIDWMVDKYRNGAWRKPPATELAALWESKVAMLSVK